MENLLNNAPLFYPNARNWMWNYCIYLGPYTNSNGENFDLGIFLDESGLGNSAAIVFGDTDGSYISGNFKYLDINDIKTPEHYKETYNRAKNLNLIK